MLDLGLAWCFGTVGEDALAEDAGKTELGELIGGEIDIVCRDRDTLVFVEVKTRTREDFGRPIAAVDREKKKRISRGGLNWLRMLDNPDILFRFDVVEVIIVEDASPRLELIKNAFPLSKPYIY